MKHAWMLYPAAFLAFWAGWDCLGFALAAVAAVKHHRFWRLATPVFLVSFIVGLTWGRSD
jgi:uncharacterized membrane protein YedE/YeeE